MGTRRWVSLLNQPDQPPPTRQFRGLPPELTGNIDCREPLPRPRVLLIEEEADGVSLFRFTEDGTCVGDTWHLSVQDAQEQVQFEYGPEIPKWKEVPSLDDPLEFALKNEGLL